MEKKLNKKRVKKNKKPKNVLVITTIYVICFSVIAGVFAYTRINKYEEGVLEVCATQQDAYVQLVLDQINLKSNRDDEPRMKQLFELDYNIDRILITIQAITGVRITPAATLIIMDEIPTTRNTQPRIA